MIVSILLDIDTYKVLLKLSNTDRLNKRLEIGSRYKITLTQLFSATWVYYFYVMDANVT